MKNEELDITIYTEIKQILDTARSKAYSTVNFVMVEAYWNIGKIIVEKQDGEKRAEYGKNLIENLSKKLTKDYGKGFDATNLGRMKQLYLLFPILDALRQELSWTHYRLILRVEDEKARNFYLDECQKSHWSTRQLERQINSFFYERLLKSQDKKAVSAEVFEKEPNITPEILLKIRMFWSSLAFHRIENFWKLIWKMHL
jgi:predicted nuclease of restriction endonuclease-like (RecB) superfamily